MGGLTRLDSALGKHITSVLHEPGAHQVYIIVGKMGAGKTVYAIRGVAYYYMSRFKYPALKAFWKALEHIAFAPMDVLALAERKTPIIIWDDAGSWISGRDVRNPVFCRFYDEIARWWKTQRTDVQVLILTTPDEGELPPFIRARTPGTIIVDIAKCGYRRLPSGRRVGRSRALAQYIDRHPITRRLVRAPLWIEYFDRHLPDPVYAKYEKVRRVYSEVLRKMAQTTLEVVGLDVALVAGVTDEEDLERRAEAMARAFKEALSRLHLR